MLLIFNMINLSFIAKYNLHDNITSMTSNYFVCLGVTCYQMGNLSFWKVNQFILIYAVHANPAS